MPRGKLNAYTKPAGRGAGGKWKPTYIGVARGTENPFKRTLGRTVPKAKDEDGKQSD